MDHIRSLSLSALLSLGALIMIQLPDFHFVIVVPSLENLVKVEVEACQG